MIKSEVRFGESGIEFSNYPYPPASVYPSGTLLYPSIREVILDAAPPEVRTQNGEVLFISAELKVPLRQAAKTHRLPIVSRVDVWNLILEPFIDTKFDDEHKARTLATLEANGVDRALCEEMRSSVAAAMIAYNIKSGLWDWTHLGLSDVLDALLGHLSGEKHRLSDDEFATFYRRAMDIAERAQRI